MDHVPPINRRSLLASVAAVGGSLALGFEIPFGPRPAQALNAGAEITAWIVIAPDDSIIIRVAKSEMGQGVLTALPMLVAEELECDWSKVRAQYAAPEENIRRRRAWGDMSTGGSRSVHSSQQALRRAGATPDERVAAFRAIRLDALERLGMKEETYGWNLEMQMRAARAGLRILELPVSHRCRTGGESKVSGTWRGTFVAGIRIVTTLFRIAAERR